MHGLYTALIVVVILVVNIFCIASILIFCVDRIFRCFFPVPEWTDGRRDFRSLPQVEAGDDTDEVQVDVVTVCTVAVV